MTEYLRRYAPKVYAMIITTLLISTPFKVLEVLRPFACCKNSVFKVKCLDCLLRWVQFRISVRYLSPPPLESFHALLPLFDESDCNYVRDLLSGVDFASLMAALQDEHLFPHAVELLTEILSLSEIRDYPKTVAAVVDAITPLRQLYQNAVQGIDPLLLLLLSDVTLPPILSAEDDEVAKGVCQLMVALGEHHTEMLLEERNVGILELLLSCTSHPNYEVCYARRRLLLPSTPKQSSLLSFAAAILTTVSLRLLG